MVRSGNDPPVFRVPRNGERPVFWPLCGKALPPPTSQDRGRPDRDWISLVSHSCLGSGFGTFNRFSSFSRPGKAASPRPSFSPSQKPVKCRCQPESRMLFLFPRRLLPWPALIQGLRRITGCKSISIKLSPWLVPRPAVKRVEAVPGWPLHQPMVAGPTNIISLMK